VICFVFWWDWGLNSGLHIHKASVLLLEPHLQSILLWLFWRWGVSQSICPSWPEAVIFLISTSQVARIISTSHWCPARKAMSNTLLFKLNNFLRNSKVS
jgi:hypothetical protein